MIVVGKDLGVTIGMVERLEQLRHLCRVDLIQQAGYRIELQEFLVPSSGPSLYTLTAKKNGIQFDLGRPLFLSELDKGVKELYDIMTQQGALKQDNDWYNKLVEELWTELNEVGRPLVSQTGAGLLLKWRLELAGVEHLGATILGALSKAKAHLNSSKVSPTTESEVIHIKWDEGSSLYIDEEKLEKERTELKLDLEASELLHIVERDGKMLLHLNGVPIPNLESCWITPQENGVLGVEITYTIEPKG